MDSPVSVTLKGDNGKTKDEPIIIQVPKELRELKLRPNEYGTWSSDGRKKRAELFAQQTADLEGLISAMPKASFGNGGETVINSNVRDALQLKADRYDLNIPQEVIDNILVEIKKDLRLQTDIIAEPYSLNAYQTGGKFLKHKDTPRGDDMFGTLVICLPSWFTGGTMSISLGNGKETYFEYKEVLIGVHSSLTLTMKFTLSMREFVSLQHIF